MSQGDQAPFLLFLCHPLSGHVTPILRIASGLRQRGWADIAFLSSAFFCARIEAAGLEFIGFSPDADADDTTLFDKSAPPPPVLSIIDSHHQTIARLPAQWECVKSALSMLHARDPARRVIIITEAFFYGVISLKRGALPPHGVPVPQTICVSILAPAIRSLDLPPSFGSPHPFDPSSQGRARNAALWKAWEEQAQPVTDLLNRKLLEAGATQGLGANEVFMSGANYTCHDIILQVGLREFEYARVDFPAGFKFIGVLPPPPSSTTTAIGRSDVVAALFAELTTNAELDEKDAGRCKVVVVAQGTVETDPSELIIPTLELLSSENVVTVAILGARGASLPSAWPVPPNATVVDYLSYDAVLPFADVWVHNGGYGAVMHGISHGVPMIVAGEGQDKLDNGKRVAWCGLGIDLACAKPEADKLATALKEVLAEKKYKEIAKRIQAAANKMDTVGLVEEEILKLAKSCFNQLPL
ncbi:hypothetical protein B0H63DRAFT_473898 [Podospora didyma]|uniref:Erythromycin biosynthesis protein CIII-like C-terminal domain-containing protein n=1 Tax=Podospora didyma TaxID=330526 RepID=A0AAE0U053_9PEZI|nr:hypothetical protein B0H63DRAFT_473898 [Podospora didyma]